MMKTSRLIWFATTLLVFISAMTLFPQHLRAATQNQDDDVLTQAKMLVEEGKTLFQSGQLEEALEKYETALPLYQTIENVEGELTCLMIIGVLHRELNHYQDALDAFESSLLIWRSTGYQEGESVALRNIGLVYQSMGNLEEALSYFEQTLAIQDDTQDQEAQATTLTDIGTVYFAMQDYQQALNYYQQALTIQQRIGDHEGEATTLEYIEELERHTYEHEADAAKQADAQQLLSEGFELLGYGQFQTALEKFELAKTLFETIGDHRGEATCWVGIGYVRRELSDYQGSLEAYNQSYLLWVNLDSKIETGLVLNNSGEVYMKLGLYQEALSYLYQALDIFEATDVLGGKAGVLGNISSIYHSLGDIEQALQYSEEALALFQMLGDVKREAMTLQNMGVLHFALHRYDDALRYEQMALKAFRAIEDQGAEAAALHSIAHTLVLMGEADESLNYFEKALTIRSEIGDYSGEASTLSALGLIYSGLGQDKRAIQYLQQALTTATNIGEELRQALVLYDFGLHYSGQGSATSAIAYFQQSIEVLESIQGGIKVEDLKSSYAGQQVAVYDKIVDLLWSEGRSIDAFYYSERARARAFLDQLGNQRLDLHAGIDATLLALQESLRDEIIGLQTSLQKELQEAQDRRNDEVIANITAQLESARIEYERLLTRIKVQNGEYASLVSVTTIKLDQIQSQLLDEQTTLIEYFVMDEHLLAFVISRDRFEIISLDSTRNDLMRQVGFLRNLIADKDFNSDIAAGLYNTLFAPLKPRIRHLNLIIAPHGVLHYLPFAALWDAEDERYLTEDYTITYAPSASALKFILDKRNANEGRLLALGNPDRTLPNAATEVANVAQLYNVTPLVGEQATESQIYQLASQTDILHLAVHGLYNPFNPLFTRIELAAGDGNDGNLEVHEIYGLDLASANLVVLSACETALGQQSDGDEIVGLTRAFLYAGTPSVVTSLWNVNDESTAYLMERFYIHLNENVGVAAALRQAQLDTMNEYPNPYHWAAFTLHGDGGWTNSQQTVDSLTTDELMRLQQEHPARYWLYQLLRQLELR